MCLGANAGIRSPVPQPAHPKTFWQILWIGDSWSLFCRRPCVLSSELSPWRLIKSSEASYQLRKPALIECCPETAEASTFYPAQTDGTAVFEVKFRVTAAGLERQGLSSASTVPAGTRQASSKNDSKRS